MHKPFHRLTAFIKGQWSERSPQLHNLRQALKLVWQAAPRWSTASLVLSAIQGLLPVTLVYLTALTINRMVAIIDSRSGWSEFANILPLLILDGLVLLAEQLLQNIQGYVYMVIGEYNRESLCDLVYRKAMTLDMEYFDRREYYNQLQRATVDALEAPLGMLQAVNTLLRTVLAFFTMGSLLISYAGWLPFALLLGILPLLISNLRQSRTMYAWHRSNAVNRRWMNYYLWLMTVTQAAAELRLFNLGEHFLSAQQKIRVKLRDERLALTRRHMMLGQTLAELAGMLVLVGLLLWMVNGAIQGLFSWGGLAAFYQIVNQGRKVMRALASSLGDAMSQRLAIDEVLNFIKLEPFITDSLDAITPPAGLNQAVQFKKVSFRYPGSESYALKNFDLTIPAGQIVAVVGENGAGKSTLIKLLCRFYDPNAGQVTWDGADLRSMFQDDLHRRVTVLFQQYIAYHDSAAMNIAFGDLSAKGDRARIEAAAKQAQADEVIESLPDGYDTVLGKWFGYADLSGGEWQRLALARAFLRKADLIVLDEPTSAMDTWSEAAWMEHFRDLVDGHTALIVTHRFSMAMQADIIHVMSEGQVVESGTHKELIARNGLYAQSWKQQMKEQQ
jgi:ATP-binding cassette, subfamily B, bacterial